RAQLSLLCARSEPSRAVRLALLLFCSAVVLHCLLHSFPTRRSSDLIFLVLLVLAALLGPWLMGDAATKLGLRHRNMAPFGLDAGWLYVLGADTLGRPILPRLVVGASNTLGIAARSEEHTSELQSRENLVCRL